MSNLERLRSALPVRRCTAEPWIGGHQWASGPDSFRDYHITVRDVRRASGRREAEKL